MGEPMRGDAPPPAPEKRNAMAIATLVVAILILIGVAGILGIDISRVRQPNADGLADMVQTSMNTFFEGHDGLRGAHAGSTTVMRVGENTFEGQVDVSAPSGEHRSVPVHVHYDGDGMFWNTDPGAFLFVTTPAP